VIFVFLVASSIFDDFIYVVIDRISININVYSLFVYSVDYNIMGQSIVEARKDYEFLQIGQKILRRLDYICSSLLISITD